MIKQNYYLLNENIALHSWQKLPYAYYAKGYRNAMSLSQDEFLLLLKCDGKHLLADSEALNALVTRGLCHIWDEEGVLPQCQNLKLHENRYVPAMNLAITAKCNYNCLHCFNATDNTHLASEWSFEEIQTLLDQAKDCGIHAFTITGGEPMLHPNFIDILRYIHSHHMYVEELNTNGSFITAEILKEMKSFGCTPLMKISFDGLNYHDWMRNQKGAEETALRAIKLCIEQGFLVKAQTNVHRLNIDTILPTAKLLDELGVSEMRIIRTTEAPRWAKNSDKLCEGGACLSFAEYYDEMLHFSREYVKEERRMMVAVWQFLNIFPQAKGYGYRPIFCNPNEYRDSIPVCRGNRGMVAVTAEGDMVPCLQMSGWYASHNIKLGNVREERLEKLLSQSPYLDTICSTVGDLAKANETCKTCKWWKLCTGGCRAIGLALTGNPMGEDKAKCYYFNQGYIEKTDKAFENSGYSPIMRLVGGVNNQE